MTSVPESSAAIASPGHIIASPAPTESTPNDFGVIRRILRRDQIPEATEHTITVDTTRECVRDLSGEITILHKAGEPLENLNAIPLAVSLRYGAGVTSPATIQPPPAKIACATDQNCPQPNRCIDPEEGAKFCGCDDDADCPSGQICYTPQNRCALDLEGSDAYRRADLMTTDGTANLLATVYTHCEGEVEELKRNNIRVRVIGRREGMPAEVLGAWVADVGDGPSEPSDPQAPSRRARARATPTVVDRGEVMVRHGRTRARPSRARRACR